MNQQTGYPLPPPPPTPGVNSPTGPVMSERQRPSIATNLVRTLGNPSQTPVSSSSYGPATPWTLTPGTPSPLNPRTPSALAPPSAVSPRTTTMEPYDPRQWSNRGQVSGTQMVFQNRGSAAFTGTREATGMEGLLHCLPERRVG